MQILRAKGYGGKMRQQSCHTMERMKYPKLFRFIKCKIKDHYIPGEFLYNLGTYTVEAILGHIEWVNIQSITAHRFPRTNLDQNWITQDIHICNWYVQGYPKSWAKTSNVYVGISSLVTEISFPKNISRRVSLDDLFISWDLNFAAWF